MQLILKINVKNGTSEHFLMITLVHRQTYNIIRYIFYVFYNSLANVLRMTKIVK
jgi:hypothetical protein